MNTPHGPQGDPSTHPPTVQGIEVASTVGAPHEAAQALVTMYGVLLQEQASRYAQEKALLIMSYETRLDALTKRVNELATRKP